MTFAILAEVAGTTCTKLSAGFTKSTPSVLMWLFYGVCFYFLTLALKKVDVSVAYAWSGVGTALIATLGVLYFREPISTMRGTSYDCVGEVGDGGSSQCGSCTDAGGGGIEDRLVHNSSVFIKLTQWATPYGENIMADQTMTMRMKY